MLTNKILFTINSLKKLFRFTIPFDYFKILILIRKNSFNLKKYSN